MLNKPAAGGSILQVCGSDFHWIDSAQVQVSPAEWDACATGSGEVNPFLLWSFLNTLEQSGSAVSLTSSWLGTALVSELHADSVMHCRCKGKAGLHSMYYCTMTLIQSL